MFYYGKTPNYIHVCFSSPSPANLKRRRKKNKTKKLSTTTLWKVSKTQQRQFTLNVLFLSFVFSTSVFVCVHASTLFFFFFTVKLNVFVAGLSHMRKQFESFIQKDLSFPYPKRIYYIELEKKILFILNCKAIYNSRQILTI